MRGRRTDLTTAGPARRQDAERGSSNDRRGSGPAQGSQDTFGNLGALRRLHTQRRQATASSDPLEAEARKIADVAVAEAWPGPTATDSAALAPARSGVPPPIRARLEPMLGASLAGVTLHADANAAALSERHGLRAFARGADVYFGTRAQPSYTREGFRTLAHELTHVVQQGGAHRVPGLRSPIRGRTAPRLQGQPEPSQGGGQLGFPFVIGDPLSRYHVLREVLTPEDWEALNAAAYQRGRNVSAQASLAPPAEQRQIREVELPLSLLFRPTTAPDVPVEWRTEAFTEARRSIAGGGSIDQRAMADLVERSILASWLAQNRDLLGEAVRVALVDPAGEAGGPPCLVFQVRGEPVESLDGGLYAFSLDPIASGTLAELQASAQQDLQELQDALVAVVEADLVLRAARDLIGRPKRNLVRRAVEDVEEVLRQRYAALGSVGGIYSAWAAESEARLRAFQEGPFATFRADYARWQAENPRPQTPNEQLEETGRGLRRLSEENEAPLAPIFSVWMAQAEAQNRMGHGLLNKLQGDEYDLQQQAAQAYDEGNISLSALLEYADAVDTRGDIMLGVSGVLFLLSLPVGGWLAPVGSGLARTVLVYGLLEAGVAAAPLIGANIYTGQRELRDPTMQAVWEQTRYTPGQIALTSAIGFGIGGGFAGLGWLAGNLGTARGLVRASQQGLELPPLDNVIARSTAPGRVEVSIAGQSGHVELTPLGWRALQPAGEAGELTVVASGSWASATAPRGMHGVPFEVGAGPSGWSVAAPTSQRVLQFGTWLDPAAGGMHGLAWHPSLGALQPSMMGSAPFYGAGTSRALLPPGSPGGMEALLAPPQRSLILAPGQQLQPYDPHFGIGHLFRPRTPASFQASPVLNQLGWEHLPPIGSESLPGRWVRDPSGNYLPEFYFGQGEGTQVVAWTQEGRTLLVVESPGVARTALVTPAPVSGSGPGRAYPMTTEAMTHPVSGEIGARSHLVPLRDGTYVSTRADVNYVSHLSHTYNERLRRTLEGRFRREGHQWFAYNVMGRVPQYSTGGHPIPEAEIIIEMAPTPRGWKFPNQSSLYENLPRDIDDAIRPFALSTEEVQRILSARSR